VQGEAANSYRTLFARQCRFSINVVNLDRANDSFRYRPGSDASLATEAQPHAALYGSGGDDSDAAVTEEEGRYDPNFSKVTLHESSFKEAG
jgi:hypothetical protein